MKQRGFTLIELLVVIAIIGVLAAIIAPNAFKAIEKAKITRLIADIKNIKTAGYIYYSDTGDWPLAGVDSYDPGTGDENGFLYFLEDDGSGKWDGPYLEKYPGKNPWGGTYRYWKSNITGTVRGPNDDTISVNGTKCAALTINRFPNSSTRDRVDEAIRKTLGLYSYVGGNGGGTDGYYITVLIWMEKM